MLGAVFLWGSVDLGAQPDARNARCALFGFSITYVTLLFGALTLDVLVH